MVPDEGRCLLGVAAVVVLGSRRLQQGQLARNMYIMTHYPWPQVVCQGRRHEAAKLSHSEPAASDQTPLQLV